ncbi:MAG TPA: FG-GAP-like repeat-containing protein, partial [Prosthecobacter sp.]|nr:FG-GAP-like repeat-containing protein [Prosthecobacter sp.]
MKTKPSLVLLLALAAFVSASHGQPQITGQPASQSVSLGADVTFIVSAAGTLPVAYQWRFNETDIQGASLRSLGLTNVQTSQAGRYSAIVSDANGSVTSQPAILTVDPTFTRITSGDIVTRIGRSQGIAWADYDGDGHLDIYVVHGGINHEGILYRNAGDGTFLRIATGTTAIEQRSTGCAWADFDNDGHLDLFAGSYNQTSVLYRNNRSGDFTRSFFEMGQGSAGLAWGDYDNDGHLDLFVSNGGLAQFASARNDFLYRNDGNGTLVKMSANQVGNIAADAASGVGAAWADYDGDGLLDLFVATWGQANLLYRNTGQGSFERILAGDVVNAQANSTGCAWGDYDNDGDL